ncbi:hypothetical protein D9M71_687550 [compost metagenome]
MARHEERTEGASEHDGDGGPDEVCPHPDTNDPDSERSQLCATTKPNGPQMPCFTVSLREWNMIDGAYFKTESSS